MRHSFASLKRRLRSTPGERADWVRRFHRSGLLPREFAERHHLGHSTLRKWMAQNEIPSPGGAAAQPVWQEVKLATMPGATRWAVEVVRPDGLVVRLAPDAPAALLEELLRPRPC
jgi:hypothetical protein